MVMRPFQFVKSAFKKEENGESRLSEEFEGKSGNEIVDIVSHKTRLEE